MEGVVATSFDPCLAICGAAQKFQQEKGRWPMHYEELLGFLKVRDRELHNALNSRHYNRVEFKELADGQFKFDLDSQLRTRIRVCLKAEYCE